MPLPPLPAAFHTAFEVAVEATSLTRTWAPLNNPPLARKDKLDRLRRHTIVCFR